MLISSVPIHHRIKYLQPIFTIHKISLYFATGGVNGEAKIWDLNYNLVKTIKKHSGSVTSVKFSINEQYLATAGDDGKVHIFSLKNFECIHTIKHSCDVTNVEWTPSHIISVDLDGFVVITTIHDFSEIFRMNMHNESIIGLTISRGYKHMVTYSESKIILYENNSPIKTQNIEKGLIIENLNSRLSFSPDGKYFSVGLQFNGKSPSVDILNLNLERVFSLVGHVAPSEITAFCPHVFKKEQKFSILAVASQDLALSIWSTINPKPFILIKNFTESPVLDLYWDGMILYACSYDGLVKKIEFTNDDFGEILYDDNDDDNDYDLPFSITNEELKKSFDQRVDKLNMDEKIPSKDLGSFTIDGADIKSIINEELNKKQENNLENFDPSFSIGKLNITSESLADSKQERIKVEQIQPKRIVPVQLNPVSSVPVMKKSQEKSIVMFDTNIPDRLKITRSKPFKDAIGNYTIELNEKLDKIIVFRGNKYLFGVNGFINKVAYDKKYLILYTSHLQIYEIDTGCLVMPFILIKIAFMDILNDKLLVVNTTGELFVYEIKKKRQILNIRLPKTKGLNRIQLDEEFFIIAEYDSEEYVFFDNKLLSWFALNPPLNSIFTKKSDYSNDNDETMNELYNNFLCYVFANNQAKMEVIAKQIINTARVYETLPDANEYKILKVFEGLKNQEFKMKLLEEMNVKKSMQKLVEKLYSKVKKENIK